VLENLEEFVSYHCDRLEGPDADIAFHSLIQAPRKAVPVLVRRYHTEARTAVQAAIVEVVSHFRDPTTVPFLATALRSESERVWKQALDGLVTVGGGPALEALRSERRCAPAPSVKVEWIDEAIEQVQQSGSSS
jgi:hypothetical protein